MRTGLRRLLLATLLLMPGLLRSVVAAGGDPEDPAQDSARIDRWLFLPRVFWNPDTRLGLGVAAVQYFRAEGESEGQDTRLSVWRHLAGYTLNRQFDFHSAFNVFLAGDRWAINGDFRYRDFVDRYYGIGNESSSEEEEWTYQRLFLAPFVQYRLSKHWYTGLNLRAERYFDLGFEDDGLLNQRPPVGARGGWLNGIGPVLSFDQRMNAFTGYNGWYARFSAILFTPWLGSDFNAQRLAYQASRYWPLSRTDSAWVLAAQIKGMHHQGDIPFFAMASVGGTDMLRAYAENRYRDDHFNGAQIELRFPLLWRLSGAVFSGLGDVYRDLSQLSRATTKYAYGGGIRFQLQKDESVVVRLDYGRGREANGFYLLVGQAF